MVGAARDRGALSDELHFAAATPMERRHLDHGSANVLRALDLPDGATVLQVGAGYGALTRYLGELAAAVHAVEPDAAAAEITALRTADLPGVVVSAAMPKGGTYDLAVVAQPYATPALLRSVPAGAVCVAVDDVSGRREVEAALRAAGTSAARVLRCAPDHHVARAVLTDELVTEHPRLAAAIGAGPARGASATGATGATSTAGAGAAGVNGCLVLAGDGAAALWPDDRLATYFNTAERAAVWCTRADVVRTGKAIEVRRAPLLPGAEPVDGISVRACVDAVVDAPTMLDVLLEEPWRATELLTGWRDLLRTTAPGLGPALWDLVPHNVLVDGDTLRPIDLEWEHARCGVPEVVERGLLVLGHLLADAGWRGAADGGSMRELAGWLGVLLGLEPSYLDRALEREVEFATIASCGTTFATVEVSAAIRSVWQQRVDQRVLVGAHR